MACLRAIQEGHFRNRFYITVRTKRTRQEDRRENRSDVQKMPRRRSSASEQYNRTIRNLSNKEVRSDIIKNNEPNSSVVIYDTMKYVL